VLGGGLARHVNGILGLLLKTHFLGIIDFTGKREPAYTFDHYFNGPDAEEENKAVRVKWDFWVSLHRTTLLSKSHSLEFS
jgi:hypothetical protein